MIKARTAGEHETEEELTVGDNVGRVIDHLADSAREKLTSVGDKASEYYHEGVRKTKEVEQKLEKQIKANPMKTLLIAIGVAAGAGFALAWLTRR